jgi:hypothetical protein
MDRDATRFPDDANGDVLFNLFSDGDALTAPRLVDFQLFFEGKDAAANARACATRLESLGYDTIEIEQWEQEEGDAEPPADLPFDLRVIVEMVPTYAEIGRLEALFDAEARAHGGEADGWGCFTVK